MYWLYNFAIISKPELFQITGKYIVNRSRVKNKCVKYIINEFYGSSDYNNRIKKGVLHIRVGLLNLSYKQHATISIYVDGFIRIIKDHIPIYNLFIFNSCTINSNSSFQYFSFDKKYEPNDMWSSYTFKSRYYQYNVSYRNSTRESTYLYNYRNNTCYNLYMDKVLSAEKI